MKFYYLILLLLLSCEELEEQTTPLSGLFYVTEGWDMFMAQDYDRAKELFSATLIADEGNETSYDDYAYSGLGWTAIYKANVNPGSENESLRKNLRLEAIDYFELGSLAFEERLSSGILSSSDSILYSNIMAGKVFSKGYIALEKSVEYYTVVGLNEDDWLDALSFSQSVITESDTLIDIFSNYNFKYDEDIDIDDIRFLRSQSYLRLNDYENAANEINLMNQDIGCDLNTQSIAQCLSTFTLD